MSIAFSLVPSTLRTPGVYVEFDNTKAVRGLPLQEHRVLCIGQRLTAGTKAALDLVECFTADDAKGFFGDGSHLHHMVAAARGANKNNRIFAIALADVGGGVQATGTITFTGPASAAGTLHLYIAGRKITVSVASGASAGTIATAVAAAINAAVSSPVTAAVDGVVTTQVNTTHRHKGEIGNEIDIRVNYNAGELLPTGVGVVIVQPASGASNPVLATALAAIGDEWFNEIACPYVDATSLTALETELNDRWGPLRPIEGHAFITKDDTSGNLTTFGNGRNSPFVTTLGIKNCPTPAYEISSVMAAIVAAEAQLDPARPLTGVTLTGVLAPAFGDRFTQIERNALLADGVSTLLVGAGGTVNVERLISMWQVNAAGTADESYYDLNTLLTLGYLRYSLRVRLASRFQRSKLARDGTRFGAGQPVITPRIAKAEVVALFDEWEAAGLVENVDQFIADLVVVINTNPVRLDILCPPDLVNPLLITAVKLEFRR